MINAKAWNAQVRQILSERMKLPRQGSKSTLGVQIWWTEDTGEPSPGALCFIPDDSIELDEDGEFPQLSDQRIMELIQGEPLMISLEEDNMYLMLHSIGQFGSFNLDEMDMTVCEENAGTYRGNYVIEVLGLNIPLQDMTEVKTPKAWDEPTKESKSKRNEPPSFL